LIIPMIIQTIDLDLSGAVQVVCASQLIGLAAWRAVHVVFGGDLIAIAMAGSERRLRACC
jgi:hypothetical protein